MDELLEAQKLAEKLNAPFGVYLHSFFHQGAFDRGDLESAEKHLQDYLSHMDEIPAGLRNVVLLDAAFFYAFAKNDLETAMAYWQRFQTAALIPKAQIFATEASIAFLKADYKLAKIKIESSLQELPNMIDRGVGFVLQERLLTMRATIEGYTNSSSEKPVRTTAD